MRNLHKIRWYLTQEVAVLAANAFLVVVWTIVTLCLEVFRVFRILLHVLSYIIESMLMLHSSLSDSTVSLSTTTVSSKLQHWFINFYTVLLIAILDHLCLLADTPTVPGSHPDRQYLTVTHFHSSLYKSVLTL